MRLDKIKAISFGAMLLGSGGRCTIDFHPSNDKYISIESPSDANSSNNIFQKMVYTLEDITDEITGEGYENTALYVHPIGYSKVRETVDHRFFIFKYRFPWQEDAFKVFHLKKTRNDE